MDWSALAVAIAVGCAGIAATILTGTKGWLEAFFARARRRVNRESYTHGLRRMTEFHLILERLRSMSFVDRVLVFVGRNGGGIPDPSKDYTVTCIYGFSQDGTKSPEKAYNFPMKPDSHYFALLEDTNKNGRSIQTTSKMADASQLKKYYRDEGVVQSYFHLLRLSDNDLLFLSTGSYRAEFTPSEVDQIELMVERLRSIMAAEND